MLGAQRRGSNTSVCRGFFRVWLFLCLITSLIACQPQGRTSESLPESGAALFTWGAYYDTDIEVGSFFGADHSVMVRFMAQYERSYEGPLFTSVGTGSDPLYTVSLIGEFVTDGPPVQPHLSVRLGSTAARYIIPYPVPATPDYAALTRAPTPPQAVWRHLFVVRRDGRLEVWLDGDHLCRKGETPTNCDLPVGSVAPRGHIRLGKRPIGDPSREPETQFYGLIDDLAILDHALTQAELSGWFLTSSGVGESTTALRVGINFDRPLPGDGRHVRPPSSLSGTARIVVVGAQHASGIDAPTLPIINGTQPMELPFAAAEIWEVLQEFNTLGSHAGGAAFSWDFIYVPNDHPRGQPRLNGADGDGRTFISASGGTVEVIQQQFSRNIPPANFIVVRRSSDDLVSYLHLRQSSAMVRVNDSIQRGQRLGLVSNVGGGTPHLHLAVLNRPETLDGEPFTQLVTRPSYFVDYCASDDFGQTWSVIRIGMPRLGQWVRRMRADGSCS